MINAKKLAFGAILAAVIDSVVFVIGNSADATWEAGQPYPIGYGMVLGASIVPFLVGGLVVSYMAKKNENWLNRFSLGGLIFALVGSPMGYIGGRDVPTGIALGSMHIVVGTIWYFATRKK